MTETRAATLAGNGAVSMVKAMKAQLSHARYFTFKGHEKQEYLKVGVYISERQEKRKVQVKGCRALTGDECPEERPYHPGEIVNIEPEASPFMLQPCSHDVIEVEDKNNPEDRGRGRYEYKGDQSPYLTLHNEIWVKPQFAYRAAFRVCIGQEIDEPIDADYIHHQVSYRKATEVSFKFVQQVHNSTPVLL